MCPDCGQKMDYLDCIVNKNTRKTEYRLFICHNEDCLGYGSIYNDKNGKLEPGDPLGFY